MQKISFLESDLKLIEIMAQKWDLDLNSEKTLRRIAEAVLETSTFFIENPNGKTPWNLTKTQWAYVFYFSPLNAVRMERVLSQNAGLTSRLSVQHITDFGAGLGSGIRTLQKHFPAAEGYLIERSSEAHQILNHLKSFDRKTEISSSGPHQTLVCSYSLTELLSLPDWVFKFENLIILEPATQSDGRRLQEWRQKLIDQGYHIWAPCLHMKACPLLSQSKTDWCHDRVALEAPEWFQKLEQHLPMKNSTLTVSYLVASRKAPPAHPENTVRLVGDLLKEKGKDRQMICRGDQREFLAWMHKHGKHEELFRGDLYTLPQNLQAVSNELRVLPSELK